MAKRKRAIRIGPGPPLFFAALCIAGTIFGIWINSRIYAIEMKSHAASEFDGQ